MEEQMEIKRFIADDIRAAMISVKETLGSDAVILSNRRKGDRIEILAAKELDPESIWPADVSNSQSQQRVSVSTENSNSEMDLRIQSALRRPGVFDAASYSEEVVEPLKSAGLSGPRHPSRVTPGRGDEQVLEGLNLLAERAKPTPQRAESRSASSAPPQGGATPETSLGNQAPLTASEKAAELEDAQASSSADVILDSLKQLLTEELTKVNRLASSSQVARNQVIDCMVTLGLSPDVAEEIEARFESERPSDLAAELSLQDQVVELVADSVNVFEDDFIDGGGLFAIIGASGVGKTTTVAKLAARYALKYGKESIALISTDAFKIGGQDQLQTFGKVLNIPVLLATNKKELIEALDASSDKDLVLIDSAGASLRDIKLNRELSDHKTYGSRLENILVVSSTSQLGLSEQIVKDYQHAHIRAAVVTKVDEAINLGSAVTLLIRSQVPMAYSCNGQGLSDIALAKIRSLLTSSFAMIEKVNQVGAQQKKDMSFHA